MPLLANAAQLIRANLEAAHKGMKPRPVLIGKLTDSQLKQLNCVRAKANRDPMQPEIMFMGKHIYERRIAGDGYSVDDVLLQITNAIDEKATIRASPKMTAIQSPCSRNDGYGNTVRDEIVLECTQRFPYPELYSVIPKGDKIKPKEFLEAKNKAHSGGPQNPTNPPG